MENQEQHPDIQRLLKRQAELEKMITDTLTELHRLEQEKDQETFDLTQRTLDILQVEKADVIEQLKELGY